MRLSFSRTHSCGDTGDTEGTPRGHGDTERTRGHRGDAAHGDAAPNHPVLPPVLLGGDGGLDVTKGPGACALRTRVFSSPGDDHRAGPAGHSAGDTSQEAGGLLATSWLLFNTPRSFSSLGTWGNALPRSWSVRGVVVTQTSRSAVPRNRGAGVASRSSADPTAAPAPSKPAPGALTFSLRASSSRSKSCSLQREERWGPERRGGHPRVPKITAAAPETAPGAGRKDGANTLGARGMLGARAGDGKGTAKGRQRDTGAPGTPRGRNVGVAAPRRGDGTKPHGGEATCRLPTAPAAQSGAGGWGEAAGAVLGGGQSAPSPIARGAQCDPPTKTRSPTAKAGPCGRPPRNASACRDGGRDVCGATGTGGSAVAAVSPRLLPERKEMEGKGGVPIATHRPPKNKSQSNRRAIWHLGLRTAMPAALRQTPTAGRGKVGARRGRAARPPHRKRGRRSGERLRRGPASAVTPPTSASRRPGGMPGAERKGQ